MASDDAVRSEIASIDSRLKQWFLFRRVQAERALSIKKLLEEHNFIGLACNNKNVGVVDRVMWSDIVNGRPELEDSLSVNAREMKADMYMDIFTQSCDLDNACRLPGSKYFQCLQEHFSLKSADRSQRCGESFTAFDSCRKMLQLQQNSHLQEALKRQQLLDDEAKVGRRVYPSSSAGALSETDGAHETTVEVDRRYVVSSPTANIGVIFQTYMPLLVLGWRSVRR